MPRDPITPSIMTRPGAWENLNIFERSQYMEGLQNRNKTSLLDALGSAPPLVEEPIPEDHDMRLVKQMIYKSLKKLGDYSGAMGFMSGVQQVTQQNQSRYFGQLFFGLEQIFLPLQRVFNEAQYQYEAYINQYQEGAAWGSLFGAGLGYLVGYIYLGPYGSQLLGWIGQVGGAMIGGKIQQAIEEYNAWEWIADIWGPPLDEDLAGWYPHEAAPTTPGDQGLPYHRERMGQAPTRSRYQGLINKMVALEGRFY